VTKKTAPSSRPSAALRYAASKRSFGNSLRSNNLSFYLLLAASLDDFKGDLSGKPKN
jgi:hypothetical protein|tara:strand:- start:773 stop:943 length:171 start_codon:yes stop_codon:yes gene_type:complete